jgi:hypothetical protein
MAVVMSLVFMSLQTKCPVYRDLYLLAKNELVICVSIRRLVNSLAPVIQTRSCARQSGPKMFGAPRHSDTTLQANIMPTHN